MGLACSIGAGEGVGLACSIGAGEGVGSGELACSIGAGAGAGSGELSLCFKVPFLDFNLLALFLALRIFLVCLKIFSDIFDFGGYPEVGRGSICCNYLHML